MGPKDETTLQFNNMHNFRTFTLGHNSTLINLQLIKKYYIYKCTAYAC